MPDVSSHELGESYYHENCLQYTSTRLSRQGYQRYEQEVIYQQANVVYCRMFKFTYEVAICFNQITQFVCILLLRLYCKY